jgi:hypothetical protein
MSVLTAGAPPRATLRYQLDTSLARMSPAERAERGKSARAAVPRESHAVFDPPPDRPDPLGLLEEQAEARASMPIESMVPRGMRIYGELCGWTLARAHARSGDRIAIAAYLGGSDVFDKAITRFAAAYADQNERDHKALVDAVASGRIAAEPDL